MERPGNVIIIHADVQMFYICVIQCFSTDNMYAIWWKCAWLIRYPSQHLMILVLSLIDCQPCITCVVHQLTTSNDVLVDKQNGFRMKRGKVDHISPLTNLIYTNVHERNYKSRLFVRLLIFGMPTILWTDLNWGTSLEVSRTSVTQPWIIRCSSNWSTSLHPR